MTALRSPTSEWTQDLPEYDDNEIEHQTSYDKIQKVFHEPRSSRSNDINLGKKEKLYKWEELVALETRRRSLLRRTTLPFWRILTYWDGTCLRSLYMDPLVWFTLFCYGFVRIQARYFKNLPRFVEELGNTDVGIIGGFLSFFLVLFVNQTNTRFQEMYKQSMACVGKISDVAALTVVSLPHPQAFRLVRYLNAAHAAGYVGLNEVYSKEEFFDRLNKVHKFLNPVEMERIEALDMNSGSDAAHELVVWALMDVQKANKAGYIDARESSVLKEKILSFESHMDSLYDMCDQPLHFFYIHFLCLLSVMYLPLFALDNAYSAGVGGEVHWSLDVVMGLIVCLQSIFVVGLRVLGQKMVDPYGDDLEDLSVIHYVKEAWKSSNRILATQFPHDVEPNEEEELENEKESIGAPWETFSYRRKISSNVHIS